MKQFWVDFSGYLKVEADSKEDAERKMWEWINSHNLTGDFSDDVWDIDCIEEVDEGREEIVEGD